MTTYNKRTPTQKNCKVNWDKIRTKHQSQNSPQRNMDHMPVSVVNMLTLYVRFLLLPVRECFQPKQRSSVTFLYQADLAVDRSWD